MNGHGAPAPAAPAPAPPRAPKTAPPPAPAPAPQKAHAGGSATPGKGKKKGEPSPVDPAVMYESLKSRIAALEEEEVHEEEEERRYGPCPPPLHSHSCYSHRHTAEEAQSAVTGMSESAIHAKYIELVRARARGPRRAGG
jgi:hypothetical protein